MLWYDIKRASSGLADPWVHTRNPTAASASGTAQPLAGTAHETAEEVSAGSKPRGVWVTNSWNSITESAGVALAEERAREGGREERE